MTRVSKETPSGPSERPLPILTNTAPAPSPDAQPAHNALQPDSTQPARSHAAETQRRPPAQSQQIHRQRPDDILDELAPEYAAAAQEIIIGSRQQGQCRPRFSPPQQRTSRAEREATERLNEISFARIPQDRQLSLTPIAARPAAAAAAIKSSHGTDAPQRSTSAAATAATAALLSRTCEACYERKDTCSGTSSQCGNCKLFNLPGCDYSRSLPTLAARLQPAWQFPSSSSAGNGKLHPHPHTHVVPAAHGFAFEVAAGTRFRVIDLHGAQVVDFMAWVAPYTPSSPTAQHLSMSYTRHALGGSAPPQVGECLFSNADAPMFRLTADSVKTHDMLFMACNPGFYARRRARQGHTAGAAEAENQHRSCATNVAEAMAPWGMRSWHQVTDPFNIFQNTPYYSLKALGCSRADDYVEFEALVDAVCAVSSCPYDGDGFNGGKVTDVAVVTGI